MFFWVSNAFSFFIRFFLVVSMFDHVLSLFSSPYVLSSDVFFSLCFLSSGLLSSCLLSFHMTWQRVGGKIGQVDAEELNLEDQMVCVQD